MDGRLKRGWLSEIGAARYTTTRLTALFSRTARVVQMWRDAGVTCFRVAPGELDMTTEKQRLIDPRGGATPHMTR